MESPAVLKADVASNSRLKRGIPCSVKESSMKTRSNQAKVSMIVAKARKINSDEMVRPWIVSSLRPVRICTMAKRAIVTVVTFKPLPVDTGPAPISIKAKVRISVGDANAHMSVALNPADLGVAAPKSACVNFSSQGKACRLL